MRISELKELMRIWLTMHYFVLSLESLFITSSV